MASTGSQPAAWVRSQKVSAPTSLAARDDVGRVDEAAAGALGQREGHQRGAGGDRGGEVLQRHLPDPHPAVGVGEEREHHRGEVTADADAPRRRPAARPRRARRTPRSATPRRPSPAAPRRAAAYSARAVCTASSYPAAVARPSLPLGDRLAGGLDDRPRGQAERRGVEVARDGRERGAERGHRAGGGLRTPARATPPRSRRDGRPGRRRCSWPHGVEHPSHHTMTEKLARR